MNRRAFLLSALGAGGAAVVPDFRGLSSVAHAEDGWEPTISSFDKVMGTDDAPVTMIEYASFTCPHCARFHNDTLPKLKDRYIDTGEVRLVFRDFPLDRLALRAGMLARCAPSDRYFPLVDVLFAQQLNWVRADDPLQALGRIGRLAGLAQSEIDRCLNDQSLADRILAMRAEASKTYAVDATPTFIIEGRKLSGAQPFEALATVIDPLLQGG